MNREEEIEYRKKICAIKDKSFNDYSTNKNYTINPYHEEHNEIFKYFDTHNTIKSIKSNVFNNFLKKYRNTLDTFDWYDEVSINTGKLITASKWKESYEKKITNFKTDFFDRSIDFPLCLRPDYRFTRSCGLCGLNEKLCKCSIPNLFIKSPRIYPMNKSHFIHLSKEFRSLVLKDFIEFDIKFSQLALLIKRLDLQEAPLVIEKFGSPWKYYESIKLSKKRAKPMIYSSAFGMSSGNVAKSLGMSESKLLTEPVIREILSKRDAEMNKYSLMKCINLPNGKSIDINLFKSQDSILGKSMKKSLFACEMQSIEFCIMAKIFQQMNVGALADVVSYILHDAIYIDPTNSIPHDFLNALNQIEPGIMFEKKVIE